MKNTIVKVHKNDFTATLNGGDDIRKNTVYHFDHGIKYNGKKYDEIFVMFCDCKRNETAARRFKKIVGDDIDDTTIIFDTVGDDIRIVYGITYKREKININFENGDIITNDTDDTKTETDTDTAAIFARIKKMCGASLKYDATKSGNIAAAVYTFDDGKNHGTVTKTDTAYIMRIENVKTVISFNFDGTKSIITDTDDNNDTRTAYRRALDAANTPIDILETEKKKRAAAKKDTDIDDDTEIDTAHNINRRALYDDDIHRTYKLDKRATQKRGCNVYKINSICANNAAAAAAKYNAINGDTDDTKKKPKRAPRYRNGNTILIDSETININCFYTGFITPRVNKFDVSPSEYPQLPFIEIVGDVTTKRGKTTRRTFHIVNNTTPYGFLLNALIIARLSVRLKIAKLSKNGGATVPNKLFRRDETITAIISEMTLNYNRFGNMQIYDDTPTNDDTDDAPKTDTKTDTAPTNAFDYITAKFDIMTHTDDGEIVEMISEILAVLYRRDYFLIKKPTELYRALYSGIDARRVYVRDDGDAPTITAQKRYDALSTVSAYIADETKTIEIDTSDENGETARDKNGAKIKQKIKFTRIIDTDDTDTDDDDGDTETNALDTATFQTYLTRQIVDDDTAAILDDIAEYISSLDAETENFARVYADICGGDNRNGGNGNNNGLRTVAKICGISHRHARTLETRLKKSFKETFNIEYNHVSAHTLRKQIHAELLNVSETAAKTAVQYIKYNNTIPTPHTNIETVNFDFDDTNILEFLAEYDARRVCDKYVLRRVYRDMMINFKKA